MKINLKKKELRLIIDAIYTEMQLIEITPDIYTNKKKIENHYVELQNLMNKLEDLEVTNDRV